MKDTGWPLVFLCALSSLCAASGQANPKAPQFVDAWSHLVHRVDPIYPDDARNAQIGDTVSMRIVISTDGSVKKLKVVSGPPQLVPAAALAVRQWRYKPFLSAGKPTEVDTLVYVVFDRNSAGQPPIRVLRNSKDVSVAFSEIKDLALITVQVPRGIYPTIYVDVNDNRAIDANADLAYAAGFNEGMCNVFLRSLAPLQTSNCGTHRSAATLAVGPADDGVGDRFTWAIPKAELSVSGNGITFLVGIFDVTTRGFRFLPSDGFGTAYHVDFAGRTSIGQGP